MQNKIKRLKELTLNLAKSVLDEKKIKEMNSSGATPGYNTPHAFSNNEKHRKKLLKKALKQVGYTQVSEINLNEEISEKDLKLIKTVMKDTIANFLRDIWLKRTIWKK